MKIYSNNGRRITALDIALAIVFVLLLVLALYLFVGAIALTIDPHLLAVPVNKAWQASLTTTVLASGAGRLFVWNRRR